MGAFTDRPSRDSRSETRRSRDAGWTTKPTVRDAVPKTHRPRDSRCPRDLLPTKLAVLETPTGPRELPSATPSPKLATRETHAAHETFCPAKLAVLETPTGPREPSATPSPKLTARDTHAARETCCPRNSPSSRRRLDRENYRPRRRPKNSPPARLMPPARLAARETHRPRDAD